MKVLKICFIPIVVFTSICVQAQTTILGNGGGSATDYLGWNATANFDLNIQHEGDQNINILRNGFNRMQFQTANWSGISPFAEPNANRLYLGLNGNVNSAWSMLHLWSGEADPALYRNWFNVGTSYTANGDFMYVGLMEGPPGIPGLTINKQTDAVITWGCQEQPDIFGGADNFRFIFITPYG